MDGSCLPPNKGTTALLWLVEHLLHHHADHIPAVDGAVLIYLLPLHLAVCSTAIGYLDELVFDLVLAVNLQVRFPHWVAVLICLQYERSADLPGTHDVEVANDGDLLVEAGLAVN